MLGFSNICAYFCLWFLNRSDPFVSVMCIDEFMIVGNI